MFGRSSVRDPWPRLRTPPPSGRPAHPWPVSHHFETERRGLAPALSRLVPSGIISGDVGEIFIGRFMHGGDMGDLLLDLRYLPTVFAHGIVDADLRRQDQAMRQWKRQGEGRLATPQQQLELVVHLD